MADALGYWRDEAALDGRSRRDAALWRPLLAEGLIGSGRAESAAAVLAPLRVGSGEVAYLQPALAWLDGWLAEELGSPEEAQRIYQRGEDTAGTDSPVHTARLLLAHGRLLRRTGHRKDAVERLSRATGCTWPCAPRRSSPGPKRSWRPAIFPLNRPSHDSPARR
jgi:hypothetical protein